MGQAEELLRWQYGDLTMRGPEEPILVPVKGTASPWFVDPSLRRIHSGAKHGMKCVLAAGPLDGNRFAFAWSQNPKDRLWKMGRGDDSTLVVHECLWFPLDRCKAALRETLSLLDRAGVPDTDGWRRFPKHLLRPLMLQGAEKAGVTGLWHRDFHAHVLHVETLKLRAELTRAEVDPRVVAAHRCV